MRYHEIMGKKLTESETNPIETGRYDPAEDEFSHQNIDDTRKPKLTLRMINRLKKIRATKDLEMAKKDQFLGVMYGNNGEDEDSL